MDNLVLYRWRSNNNIQLILALQALLDDLHVKHSEETAAEPKVQGLGSLRFEDQSGVIKLEFFKSVP